MNLRTVLMVSTALAAVGIPGIAGAAQDQTQPVAPAPVDPVAANSVQDPDDGGEIIVVTAQKRTENQQDVPISISVLSGENLVESGATQLTEFAGYVPGLHVSSNGAPGSALLTLRGIPPLGGNASVGTYVDDGPIGSSTAYTESGNFTVDLLPYDITRIEVLRGPQGTLYGASTLGGLLKYVTIAPDLDEFRGRVGIEGFGINHAGEIGYAAQAFVNVPIILDRLAVTASFAHRNTPGWIDNVQTGEKDQNGFDQTGFRGSLLWQPSDKLRIRLSAMRQTIDSDSTSTIIEDLTGNPIGNGRSNFNYIPEPFKSKFTNYAGTVEYDFGLAALSSTTTFTDSKRVEVTDASHLLGTLFPLLTGGAIGPGISRFENQLTMEKLTEEVRLTSPSGGRFEWLLGYFYTDENAGNGQLINSFDFAGAVIAPLNPLAVVEVPSTYKEHSVFGNATFRFTDQFWLSGGLRWAHNNQTFKQLITSPLLGNKDQFGKSKESIVTYSVSPQFHLNSDTMFYGRVATGYRPGGPNVALPNVPASFKPDTITNYELGVKTRLANRTVTLDVALFQMDWKDIQVSKTFAGTSGLANGNGARSKGVEAAMLWQPGGGLTLGANGAYTDSELTDDAPEIGGFKGDRLPNIPKFSGSLTAEYKFRVGSLPAELGGGIRHTGKRVSDVGFSFPGVPGERGDKLSLSAYTAVDLNGSVTFMERYKVRAYVRNLTDEGGPIARGLSRDFLNSPAYISVVPLQPRTIGIALDVSF